MGKLLTVAALFMAMTLPTLAADIDDHTPCSVAVTAFDGNHPDDVSDVATYIVNTIQKLDEDHVDNGEPGILAQMSDQGEEALDSAAVVYCRQHPKSTIYNQAAEAYRGVRDMEMELGGAK